MNFDGNKIFGKNKYTDKQGFWIGRFYIFFSPLILIYLFIEIRICEGVEIEDYYDDEESVDCVLVKDSAPTFEYFYNTESNCLQNTKCVNGRQCGVKGTYFYLLTRAVFSVRSCKKVQTKKLVREIGDV
jgi:hypothetical protein